MVSEGVAGGGGSGGWEGRRRRRRRATEVTGIRTRLPGLGEEKETERGRKRSSEKKEKEKEMINLITGQRSNFIVKWIYIYKLIDTCTFLIEKLME